MERGIMGLEWLEYVGMVSALLGKFAICWNVCVCVRTMVGMKKGLMGLEWFVLYWGSLRSVGMVWESQECCVWTIWNAPLEIILHPSNQEPTY